MRYGMLNRSVFRKAILFCLVFCLPATEGAAFQEYTLSKGQTVYVSVYSNIYTAPKAVAFPLEVTLVVRNTDMTHSLTMTSADFYDTAGKLVKKHVERPLVLQPLETKYIFLSIKEMGGGVGANFIVRWNAEKEINTPIIECLMSGTRSGQGIFFVSPGQVIRE